MIDQPPPLRPRDRHGTLDPDFVRDLAEQADRKVQDVLDG